MSNRDISFKNEELNIKFNFRVAGIILGNGKILLQKTQNNDYYSLIGGRVSFLEDTKEAFIREVKEETGVLLTYSEIKLINVVENFFKYDNTDFHELLFIYKVENNKELMNKDNFVTLDKKTSTNKWFKIEDLQDINLVPSLVKKIINDNNLSHSIIKESVS